MSDFYIPADAIESATSGVVNQKAMVNWNDRELWLTPVQPAVRGKPRFYSYDNALEAVVAAVLMRSGMTRERISRLIDYRCAGAQGRSGGWVGEAGAALSKLPEWSWASAWWVVVESAGTRAVLAVDRIDDIDPELFGQDLILVLNLSSIRGRLDQVLADRGLGEG